MEVKNPAEELDFVAPDIPKEKFVALSYYKDFWPFVLTFLKMSGTSSNYDTEAGHANEIILALVFAEVTSFADLKY